MPISNVESGNIIGYKYFGFGGLDKDKKGLKAFEGTRPKNKTAFNLFLAPKTKSAFKVNIWLDGPWNNDTWKGKKIGEISVPANSPQDIARFTVDVSSSVDQLDKKHAIFLVAEGSERGGLFDLVGLGFSSAKRRIARPVVPTVKINVNGKAIELPSVPVRSTNANGVIGLDLYEAAYEIPAGTTGVPAVTASASDPAVRVEIAQAESRTGTAVVKVNYRGVVKTYKVVFSHGE